MSSSTLQAPTPVPQDEAVKIDEAAGLETLFRELDAYDWASDIEFQTGLRTILGSEPMMDAEREEELKLQARCFYYSRKTQKDISIPAYQEWRRAQHTQTPQLSYQTSSTSSPSSQLPQPLPQYHHSSSSPLSLISPAQAPTYPTTFREIVDLINGGHAVPGIRDVPDTVLVGQASAPTTVERRKPWEIVEAKKEEVDGGGSVEGVAIL